MTDSAASLRNRKTRETERTLRRVARRLTVERGLHGFTVDEACAEAGVSRRTFFNYFASKENAVLGVAVRTDHHDLDEAFVAGDGPLMEALVELLVARWERTGLEPHEIGEVIRAAKREPRLIAHAFELMDEAIRDDIRLVERRQGWAAGDLRAEMAVKVLGPIVQPSLEEFFEGDTPPDLRTLAHRRLDAARTAFAL
ncbi:TetR/AcrR family transcriptional regulator [Agromyces sp. MMS24-K17]|uniref:TetR/AcrR family transcriptional regulator n=1 Tax=Agromyces sp. MMS24-K17 TaxID=3372850 RepID=UPI0037552516